MDICQKEYMERNLPESEKEHIGNTELVIATLLEYNPVSFQALFLSIAITPYIGPVEGEPAIHKDSLDRCCITPSLKGWTITPPQTHKDYIRVMLGYYCLLRFITDHTKETALGEVFLEVIRNMICFPNFSSGVSIL
uniref:Uncharacterized protein n=1 Tax=Chaetoceros debilis TaxID=122233 RepID=A0A7S3Q6Q7_9STRA|mmetsp:Transcript_9539/g.14295  ORF Transcript_9539/g.14295 Transcript_9539/m.14295 type:complete len:137 (-) Transcript_9539:59-469(-)